MTILQPHLAASPLRQTTESPQDRKGIEPFFPTITALLGIEKVLETHTHPGCGGRAGQVLPIPAPTALTSACPCPLFTKNPINGLYLSWSSTRGGTWTAKNLSLPCPKPQGTDTKAHFRKEDKHLVESNKQPFNTHLFQTSLPG